MRKRTESLRWMALLIVSTLVTPFHAEENPSILKADSLLLLDPCEAYQIYTEYAPTEYGRIAKSLLALGEVSKAIPYLERAGDMLSLGRAYFIKGELDSARRVLSTIHSAEAELLMGLCVEDVSPELALEHFREAKRTLVLIDDYISRRVAASLLKLGRFTEALSELLAVLERYPQMNERADVREELASLYHTMGYPMLARNELLSLVPRDPPRYRYSVALIELKMGWEPVEVFRQILREHPRTLWAAQSFDHLSRLGGLETEDYLYGGIAYSSVGEYERADELLHEYLRIVPDNQRALFELGLVSYELAKYEIAHSLFSLVNGEFEGDAAFYRGRCRERLGKTDQALEEYASVSVASDIHAKASYYAGRLCERTKRFGEAMTTYLTLQTQHPGSPFADDACFRTGFILYSLGRHEEAFQEFTKFTRVYAESSLLDGVLYWMAKAGNDEETRKAILTKLVTTYPRSYYSKLAYENFGVEPTPFQADTVNPFSTSPLDEQVARGFLFLQLGLVREAEQAFSEATPQQRALVSLIYHQCGITSRAISLGYGAQPTYQKVLYPRTYALTLEDVSRDPFLVLALIREESRFDPYAVSRAGAIGLAQIMPSTGSMIATELKYTDYKPESLFDIQTNLKFGSFYLEKMLEKFGRLEYALAAYNAGPHRVEKWLSESHFTSLDQFVEDIPFSETRTYVKNVIASYWNYCRTYRRVLHGPEEMR